MTRSTVSATALAASLFLVLCPALVLGSCNGDKYRGCNPPMPYTTMVGSNEAPTVHASTGFPANLKKAIEDGHKAAQSFLGGVSNTSAFLWERAGASDTVYANVKKAYCEVQGLTGAKCDEWAGNYIKHAKTNPNPKYAVEGGRSECCGGHNVNTRNAIYYIPDAQIDTASLSGIAAHEMTHLYQAMKGDYPPAWLFEGGAVHMQGIMAHKFPVDAGMKLDTYAKWFEYGGGRTKSIVDKTIEYYGTAFGKANGLKIVEDTCCGDSCGNGKKVSDHPEISDIHYDVGAMAIAFAINRANKTSLQFWTSPTLGEGFWNAIPVSNTWNYLDGHSSQVKEGEGWKKAFTAFTGDKDMATFYAAFNSWAAGANKTRLLSILEKDADIKTQAATVADVKKSKSAGILDSSKVGACAASGSPSPPASTKDNNNNNTNISTSSSARAFSFSSLALAIAGVVAAALVVA